MTAFLMLALLALVSGSVIATAFIRLPRRSAAICSASLAAWLLYVGMLSASGIVADATRQPPGIAFILLPVFAFMILVVVRGQAGLRMALAVPLPFLIGAQIFRVGVEWEFHRLWLDGLVPKMLTFEGSNVDIVMGLSAPLVAWLAARGRAGLRMALAWNVVGLLVLANVAVRAALTAPGPLNILHLEVPNLAFGTFPFTYIPGLFAPLAVALHILSIRAIRAAPQTLKTLSIDGSAILDQPCSDAFNHAKEGAQA